MHPPLRAQLALLLTAVVVAGCGGPSANGNQPTAAPSTTSGNWAEVGGEAGPIVRLSGETNSGTHVYFLEEVVRRGDGQDVTLFAPETLLLPSSEGISAEIRQNPNAIGYDGLGSVTPDLKVVAGAREASGPFELPSAA